MDQNILWDLFCFQCSLQFEKKSIYDMHLSLIHNYKSKKDTFDAIQIKKEPEEVEPGPYQGLNYWGGQRPCSKLLGGPEPNF